MSNLSFQDTVRCPRASHWPIILIFLLLVVGCRVISGFILVTPQVLVRNDGSGRGSSSSGGCRSEYRRNAPVALPMASKRTPGHTRNSQPRRADAASATQGFDRQQLASTTPSTASTKESLQDKLQLRLNEMRERVNQGESLTQAYCDSALALCVASDEWDSVLDVLDVMKGQGLSQERSTYRASFQACFEIGNGASALEMLNAMRQALMRPDPTDISLVVAAMCRNDNTEPGWWRTALTLLRETAQDAHPDDSAVPVEAYDAVLSSMKPPHWKEALQLLRQMEEGWSRNGPSYHPLPTVSTYRAVIEKCVAASQTEPAFQVLMGMPSKGITPTVYTFELVISALSKKLQWRRALQLLDVMDELNIQKTVVTYNTVISACAKAGEVGTAKSLLVRMRKQGVKPNIITFNSVISGCAGTSRWKDALSVLDQCHREPGVQPDIITYTNAMRACARGRKTTRALTLLQVVKDKNLPLDNYCYTAVIDACAKARMWRKALELLDEMEENGVKANEVTYSCAISACGNSGQWEKSLELLQLMKAKSMKVNSITYNAAITALSKASRRSAKFIEKRQATARFDSTSRHAPVDHTANDAGDGDGQLWTKALDLLDQMKSDGIEPDGFSYSAAISCCGAGGRWEEALALIDTMKKGGPRTRPNRVSYTAAITSCGRAGQYEQALQLFEDMENEGLQPDKVSWNALFSALRVANMTNKSYEYWRAMCGKDPISSTSQAIAPHTSVSPDIVTITDVLSTLSRSDQPINLERADEVFDDAVSRGILMRHDTLDSSWETDLSGMALPVARVACRFIFRRVLAMASEGEEISDVAFITGVGRAKRVRDYLDENVKKAKARGGSEERSHGITSRQTSSTSLREYVQQVLLQDFNPPLEPCVPKHAQGTVVVPVSVVKQWIAGQ